MSIRSQKQSFQACVEVIWDSLARHTLPTESRIDIHVSSRKLSVVLFFIPFTKMVKIQWYNSHEIRIWTYYIFIINWHVHFKEKYMYFVHVQRLMLGGKYVTNLHVYVEFVHCQPGELTLSIMGLKNLHILMISFYFLNWKVVRIWKKNG